MRPVVDHIQITVRNMRVAVPFYERLMPFLGFDPKRRTSAVIDEHEFHVVEYTPPGYYALYFKDLEGIKYEVVCTSAGGTWNRKARA
jgi:catechol 2,3-dioxygenase-like lactoylglutathione lyase family enzyme